MSKRRKRRKSKPASVPALQLRRSSTAGSDPNLSHANTMLFGSLPMLSSADENAYSILGPLPGGVVYVGDEVKPVGSRMRGELSFHSPAGSWKLYTILLTGTWLHQSLCQCWASHPTASVVRGRTCQMFAHCASNSSLFTSSRSFRHCAFLIVYLTSTINVPSSGFSAPPGK